MFVCIIYKYVYGQFLNVSHLIVTRPKLASWSLIERNNKIQLGARSLALSVFLFYSFAMACSLFCTNWPQADQKKYVYI